MFLHLTSRFQWGELILTPGWTGHSPCSTSEKSTFSEGNLDASRRISPSYLLLKPWPQLGKLLNTHHDAWGFVFSAAMRIKKTWLSLTVRGNDILYNINKTKFYAKLNSKNLLSTLVFGFISCTLHNLLRKQYCQTQFWFEDKSSMVLDVSE